MYHSSMQIGVTTNNKILFRTLKKVLGQMVTIIFNK